MHENLSCTLTYSMFGQQRAINVNHGLDRYFLWGCVAVSDMGYSPSVPHFKDRDKMDSIYPNKFWNQTLHPDLQEKKMKLKRVWLLLMENHPKHRKQK